MDLAKTIEAKSDQLNADDLIGVSKTIKITDVTIGSNEQPVNIRFEGDNNKPWKPSKGMLRVLVQLWGAESDNFKGHSLTLYRDEDVKFGGAEVGGIRISHATGIEKPTKVLITVARSKRRPITIEPLIISKKKMTDVQGARKAIEAGTHTFEDLANAFDLTEEQRTFLKGE